jgi:putative membrane protein
MNVLSALAYACLGIGLFAVVFLIWDRLTPYAFWKRIAVEGNQALAILVGFILLGIAWIIAAAVH